MARHHFLVTVVAAVSLASSLLFLGATAEGRVAESSAVVTSADTTSSSPASSSATEVATFGSTEGDGGSTTISTAATPMAVTTSGTMSVSTLPVAGTGGDGCLLGLGLLGTFLKLILGGQSPTKSSTPSTESSTTGASSGSGVKSDVDATQGAQTTEMQATTTAPSDDNSESSAKLWWLWVLLGVLGICCLAAMLMGIIAALCKGGKEKKTRSVKGDAQDSRRIEYNSVPNSMPERQSQYEQRPTTYVFKNQQAQTVQGLHREHAGGDSMMLLPPAPPPANPQRTATADLSRLPTTTFPQSSTQMSRLPTTVLPQTNPQMSRVATTNSMCNSMSVPPTVY